MMIPGQPLLSVLIWLIVVMVVLYLARTPAHRAILAGSRVLANAFRLSARSMRVAEDKLRARNREVLMAQGAEEIEHEVEREFHRIQSVVKRDLEGFPAFQRKLSELLIQIDEDYSQSTNVPPSPPEWVEAVEIIAKLPDKGGKMVSGVLTEIHKTLNRQHKEAMAEYRKVSSERHKLLGKLKPYWRTLTNRLKDTGKVITGLNERAALIDRRMDEYEKIMAGSDKVADKLHSSSLTQFFISGLVLAIAIGGAFINFNLIALPMSEMVGGGSYIGPYQTSDVAAMVIILVEASMGLFLMESLRITRLFPIIGTMDDKMRTRMIWISFVILLVLASVESALAFMRDRIAADIEALRQTLSGAEAVAESPQSWIPTVGQMVLGFILPFALAFVAIPLESFMHSARTVLGMAVVGLVQALAYLLRLLGNVSWYSGKFVVNVYDILVFPFIYVEEKLLGADRREDVEEVWLDNEPENEADAESAPPKEKTA
jgi:hypothetical protein